MESDGTVGEATAATEGIREARPVRPTERRQSEGCNVDGMEAQPASWLRPAAGTYRRLTRSRAMAGADRPYARDGPRPMSSPMS